MKVLLTLGIVAALVAAAIKLGIIEIETDDNGVVVARVNWNS